MSKAEWRLPGEADLPTEQRRWGEGASTRDLEVTLEVFNETKLPVPNGPSAQKTV